MTGTDPFAHDDAAYLLGALSDTERDAFERHLLGCAECAARVQELSGIPGLLTPVTAADLDEVPMPELLLPSLLRAAATRRRRGRVLVASLAGLAAACVVALVIAVWPARTSLPTAPTTTQPTQRFVALVSEPITADAVLEPKAWGTEIDLKCVYSARAGEQPVPYTMYAYNRAGARFPAGGWLQTRAVRYVGGTSLRSNEITKVEIVVPGGQAILRLTVS